MKALGLKLFIFLLLGMITPAHATLSFAPAAEFLASFKGKKEQQFSLAAVTFDVDIPFSKDEFQYLTGLTAGTMCTPREVKRAYRTLRQKGRFKQIKIVVASTDKGIHLHFIINSYWIFKKLWLNGVLWGKHQYADLYVLQTGDVFDKKIHQASCEAIKKSLEDQGYVQAKVIDQCSWDKRTKTVVVSLRLELHQRFRITQLDFELNGITDVHHKKVCNRMQRRFSPLLLKNYYSRATIVKAVDRLKFYFNKLGYSSPRITVTRSVNKKKRSVALKFSVDAGNRRTLTFSGNKFFTTATILNDVLGKDYPDWLSDPEIIAEQLIQQYYKKGFWKTVIQFQKKTNRHYHFLIKEGERLPLDGLTICDEKGALLTEEQHYLSRLVAEGYYDEELLEQGCGALSSALKKKGYWDCRVAQQRTTATTPAKLPLELVVTLGKQRLLHAVCCEPAGLEEHHKEFFKKIMATHETMIPFDQALLVRHRSDIINYFQNEGYWFVDIQFRLQPYVPTQSLPTTTEAYDLVFTIDLKQPVTFGKVLIRGATRLPFKRIMHELAFNPGDRWDRKKIELTRKKLKRLGIFKSVYVQPHKAMNKLGERPIMITLLEDEPYELQLRLGYFLTSKNLFPRRESTVQGGGSFIIKNPFNCADRLSFNANVTRFERRFDADYQIPDLFNFDCSGNIKVFANSYDQPTSQGSTTTAYRAVHEGVLVGFDKEYRLGYHWGLTVGNEWMKTNHVNGVLNLAPSLVNRTVPSFFIEPASIIETLDDKLNPTRGMSSICSLKMMIPYSHDRVSYRFMIENSFFWPISPRVIGALRVRFGHVFKRGFDHIMPVERFYLGGPNSVRGYEKDGFPPYGVRRIVKEDGTAFNEYTIQGGRSMVNVNGELRFPIAGNFGLVAFQDLGVLSQHGWSGFRGSWYPTSGFGLRYNLPFGAFRFDIGWKWKRSVPEEKPYAWYLTFGQAF